jgi:hypothetical protein
MTTETDYLYDEGAGGEELFFYSVQPAIYDFNGFTEVVEGTRPGNPRVREGGFFVTTVSQQADTGAAVYEVGHAATTLTITPTLFAAVYEVAHSTEALWPRVAAILQETINVAEVWRGAAPVMWSDRLGATELRSAKTTASKSWIDTYRITSLLIDGKTGLVEIVGTFQPETIQAGARTGKSVFEMLGWAETYTRGGLARLDVEEEPRFADSRTIAVTSTAMLADASAMEDILLTTESSAWTANTDGWQMTRYDRLPAEGSLAELNGQLWMGSLTGLYKFDRAQPVVGARFTSVWSELENDRLKLPRSLYLGYTSEQPLTVKMWITRDGTDVSYSYTMPAQLADSMLPGRLMLGRGLRSRYFKYEVENVAGGYFYIDTALIDADVSTRRI